MAKPKTKTASSPDSEPKAIEVVKVYATISDRSGRKINKPLAQSFKAIHEELEKYGEIAIIADGSQHIVLVIKLADYCHRRGCEVTFPEGQFITNKEGYLQMLQPIRVKGTFEWIERTQTRRRSI